MELSRLTDPELTELIRQDNAQAFRVVYERYWKKLLAGAGTKLGDHQEAEEALQDIFLNFWKRRDKLNLDMNFDRYFSVALKYEVIDRMASQHRRTNRDQKAGEEQNVSSQPNHRFDLQVLERELELTICTLPPKCQMVFRMSREQELSNKEIAAKLGVSEKAVEKHMTSALKVLKARFGQFLPILLFLLEKR